MREAINWLKDALTTKKIIESMAYYKAYDGEIKATDGRLIASHPCPNDLEFLVPGNEFEKIINRLEGDLEFSSEPGELKIRSGRRYGTVQTLPVNDWDYPGIEDVDWMPIPFGLIPAVIRILPFVSDNANHIWSLGVTIERGWVYATNNVALAGIQCPSIGSVVAILPRWTAEFIADRSDGLVEWAWTENYVGFRWKNGAWMRSSLIDSYFPEQVSDMIQRAALENSFTEIDDDFRESYYSIAEVAEGPIIITDSAIEARFGKGKMTEETIVPELIGMRTIWSAKHLTPVIQVAAWWSPENWPRPCAFQGDGICGYVIGRNTE